MTMEDPKTFLGIPLTPYATYRQAWRGNVGSITVEVQRELNVQWVNAPPTPVYYYAFVSISSHIQTEEAQGEDLGAIEDYFRKWVADFKETARAVFQVWPDEFNVNTRTGRLRSDVPNLSNSPKPDKPND